MSSFFRNENSLFLKRLLNSLVQKKASYPACIIKRTSAGTALAKSATPIPTAA